MNPLRCFGLSSIPLLALFFLVGCATTSDNQLENRLLLEKKFLRGTNLLEKKLYPEARQEFSEAIALDPSLPKLHSAMGWAYMKEGYHARAEEEFKTTIKLDKKFYYAYIFLGTLYMLTKRPDEALDCFSTLLNFTPDIPEFRVRYYIGWVYYEKEEFDRAFLALKRSIQLNPGYVPARHNMGLTLLALGQEDGALEQFDRALSILPNFIPARNKRGLLYLKKKMYKEALADLKAVAEGADDERIAKEAGEYVKIIEGILKETE